MKSENLVEVHNLTVAFAGKALRLAKSWMISALR